jgi:hypothetical protein
MLGLLVSAGLTCACAVTVGQLVLRVCGIRPWSWLAPAVGLAAMMVICVPALHLPGRATTTFVLLVVAALAGIALMVRDPQARPPLPGLLAGVPVALLGLVPFATAGRAGTLGVSFNNDMATHLSQADAYRSEAIARAIGIDGAYPLGAHSVVGAYAQVLHAGVEDAFSGLTLAIPVLLGWTALAALRRSGVLGQFLTATLVGMPFLVAGYYGQGSFKELMEALFVLATALVLMRQAEFAGRLRWVPIGLLIVGTLSVYSYAGIVWPGALIAVWLAVLAARELAARRSPAALVGRIRSEIVPVAIGIAITLVALAPQLPRLKKFFDVASATNGTGIVKTNLGNLAGPLPLWEAFGMWNNPDYRLPPVDAIVAGLWTAFVLALVVWGVTWYVRRGDWVVPAAAGVALLIWWWSNKTQSPYVAGKGLLILTPLLMVLAARPLAERQAWPAVRYTWAVPVAALVLLFNAVGASWDATRASKVGPNERLEQIRSIKPLLGDRPTLYLGNSDFTRWEFAGVPVRSPVISFLQMPIRPEKPWVYGQGFDFDSLDAATLNEFDFVVSPRDASASAPPPEMKLVRQTPLFDVYRRTGAVTDRALLAEGGDPGAVLDCRSPEGRKLVKAGGTAAIRPDSIGVEVQPFAHGGSSVATLRLPAGTWHLVTPYTSEQPVHVTAPGMKPVVLPPNLDRPGPRWPIGQLTVTQPGRVQIRFAAKDSWPSSPVALVYPGAVIATRAGGVREMPIRQACGQIVDYLRPDRIQD